MRRPRRPTPDSTPDQDLALFRQEVADARRLAQDRIAPPAPVIPPQPFQRLRDEREVLASLLHGPLQPEEIETGEELLYRHPALPLREFRRLRRGLFVVEAQLDLHGQTVPEAQDRLRRFLLESQKAGKRCVRIIHGKGLSSAGKVPILKGKVNNWLRRMNNVLAFCSTPPHDGGTGAVYVLLKRYERAAGGCAVTSP